MMIAILYFTGCLLALVLALMVIECWENNLYIKTKEDVNDTMGAASVMAFGSWLTVVYLLNKNKEEIRWTWRKWTEK